MLSDGEEEATVPICIVDDDEAEEGQLPSLSAAEQQQWAAIQWQEYFATANTSISPLSEAPHRPLTWRKPLFLTIHQVLKSAIRAAKHSTEAKPPLTWQGGIYQHVLLIGMVVGVRFRPKGYQCICTLATFPTASSALTRRYSGRWYRHDRVHAMVQWAAHVSTGASGRG